MIEERGIVPTLELRTNRNVPRHLRGELRLIWSTAAAYTKGSWLRRAQSECIFALDARRQDCDQVGTLHPEPHRLAKRS